MLLLEVPRDVVDDTVRRDRAEAASPAWALAGLALPVHAGMSLSESLGLGKQALECAVREPHPGVLAYASSNLGVAALAAGRAWGWSLVEQGLSAARAAGDVAELTRISINAVVAALWLGEHARAQDLVDDLRVLEGAARSTWLPDRVAALAAEIAFRTTGRATPGPTGAMAQDPFMAFLEARIALAASDPDWAELRLLPIAERGFDEGYPDLAAGAAASLAEIAMQRGDVQASISWAGRAVAPARMGAVAWWGDTLMSAVAALCHHDMVEEADEVIAEAEMGLREATAPRSEAALLQAGGALAEAAGRISQARSMYVAASRRFVDLPEAPAVDRCGRALERVSVLSD